MNTTILYLLLMIYEHFDLISTVYAQVLEAGTHDPAYLYAWKSYLRYKPLPIHPLPYLDPYLAYKLEIKLQTWDILNTHYDKYIKIGSVIGPTIRTSESIHQLLISIPPQELLQNPTRNILLHYSHLLSNLHQTLYLHLDSIHQYSNKALKIHITTLNSLLNKTLPILFEDVPPLPTIVEPQIIVETETLLNISTLIHNFATHTGNRLIPQP